MTLALRNVKVYRTLTNEDKCEVKNNDPILKCQNWYVAAIGDGAAGQVCQVKQDNHPWCINIKTFEGYCCDKSHADFDSIKDKCDMGHEDVVCSRDTAGKS